MMRLVVWAAFFVAASAAAQQMYRWTDEKGRVHITDTPPPAGAKRVQKSRPSAAPGAPAEANEQTPYDVALAMKDYPVSLYTSPVCKEPCERARDHLNKRGVPFREVQVWDAQSNEQLKRVSGANQVPTLIVASSVQKGYESTAFDELLDWARYPRAGSVRARHQGAPAAPEGYVPPGDGESRKAQPAKAPEEPTRPRGPYGPR